MSTRRSSGCPSAPSTVVHAQRMRRYASHATSATAVRQATIIHSGVTRVIIAATSGM